MRWHKLRLQFSAAVSGSPRGLHHANMPHSLSTSSSAHTHTLILFWAGTETQVNPHPYHLLYGPWPNLRSMCHTGRGVASLLESTKAEHLTHLFLEPGHLAPPPSLPLDCLCTYRCAHTMTCSAQFRARISCPHHAPTTQSSSAACVSGLAVPAFYWQTLDTNKDRVST